MTGDRRTPQVLLLVAVALAFTGLWLTLDNPDIGGTSRGDNYTCNAPYDTVLNDADNVPGGEPAPDGDDIADRCRSAGRERFVMAVGAGTAAVFSAVVAVLVWRRSLTLMPTPA